MRVWPTAEELGPEQARAFVVGKLFSYTCFEGTAGQGRIFADGSVVGTIRMHGSGEPRFAVLPAGTIRVDGGSMCAHLPGLPITPCFRVQKIDYRSFRGSLSGMGFAYCDFYQRNPRSQLISGVGRNAGGDPDLDDAPDAASVARPVSFLLPTDYSRSSRNGSASVVMTPRPMVSIAATMRPLRPSSLSASDTMRMFGVAVGEAWRSACAMLVSSRRGLSAQTLAKALAVERLMPI